MSITASPAPFVITDAQRQFVAALPMHMDRTRDFLSRDEEWQLIDNCVICWRTSDHNWYATGEAVRLGLIARD